MNILFVTSGFLHSDKNPFSIGGVQSQILGLSREFVKHGHKVYIAGRFHKSAFQDLNEEKNIGINFVNVNTPQFGYTKFTIILSRLFYSFNTCKIIKNLNPDIINLGDYYSGYFPSKLNIPKIYITHNVDAFTFFKPFDVQNNKISYLYFFFKNWLQTTIMKRVDAIVALNKDIMRHLQENGFEKVNYIPNGIDLDEYYFNDNENFILYGGRFHRVKGIEYLIEAFSNITRHSKVNLVLVGEGPEEAKLKKIVEEKKMGSRITILPFLNKNQFRVYLSNCKVFVLPSLYETFGIVVIEAMASSKPVIVSNIPGPDDIIINEYNGFLVEKENVLDLEKNLLRCLSDESLCQEMGKNARRTVKDKYTFEIVSKEYINLYLNILKNRHVVDFYEHDKK